MPENEDKRLYEGMFLFNPGEINASVATARQTLLHLLERAEAEPVATYKWDDRKLAYPIEKQKRGLYMLSYFRCLGQSIKQIEHDISFSDQIMRCLILRADHMGEPELELAKQQEAETADTAAALEGAEEEDRDQTGEEAAAGAAAEPSDEGEGEPSEPA